MLQETVKQIMTPKVVSISPSKTLSEACTFMQERATSLLVVSSEENRPLGVIAESDLLRFQHEGRSRETPVGDVMSAPVLTVEMEEKVLSAAHRLMQHNIRHLVVVDAEGKTAGIVSQIDIIKGVELKYAEFLKRLIAEQDSQFSRINEALKNKVEELSDEIQRRERTEKDLLLFKSLINQVNDAIFINDADTGRILDVNETACRRLGYAREELLSMRVIDIEAVIPDELTWAQHVKELREMGSMVLTGGHRRKDGVIIPVEVNVTEFGKGGNLYNIAVVRDITERRRMEDELKKANEQLEAKVRERAKELNCLYSISQLYEDTALSLEAFIQGTVDLIPPAWQYPEITCARITLGTQEFSTEGFGQTAWRQAAEIVVQDELLGTVEVCYRQEVPESDEGPFLKEERNLLDSIARYVQRAIGRKRVEESLAKHRDHLEDLVADRTARLQNEIAERMLLEDNLRKSAAEIEDLYDNAPCGYHSLDKDGVLVKINNTELSWLGYSREEMIGKRITDIMTPEGLELFREHYPRFKEKGWVRDLEFGLLRKDGSVLPVLLSATAIKNERGEFVMSRSTVFDITERKLMEDKLRERNEILERIFATTHFGIVYLDRDFNFIRVNKSYADSCGHPPEFFLGKNHFDLYPYEENEAIFRRVVETGELFTISAKPFEFPDHPEWGVTYWDWSLYPVSAADGSIEGLLFVLLDVTERKKTELALQASEERYRKQYRGVPVPTYTWTRRGDDFVLTDYNEAAEVITQGGIVKFIGNSLKAMFADQPDIIAETTACFVEKKQTRREFWYTMRSTGKHRYLNVTYAFLPDDQVLVHTEDLTERKLAEDELARHRDHLDELVTQRTAELFESERRFRETLENVELVAVCLDLEGNITFCNDYLCALTGWSSEEMLGRNWFDLAIPPGADVARAFRECIAREEIFSHYENEIICRSGERRLIVWSNILLRDAQGKVIGTSSIGADITEQRQIEDFRLFLARCGAVHSEDFFRLLAEYLGQYLGADYVCIDRLEEGNLAATTVAVYFDGRFEDNVTYTLKDTPCGDVVEREMCCFPAGVLDLFPRDRVLQDMKAESYAGIPLWGHGGRPIGLIALIWRQPLTNQELVKSMLQLAGVRAAGELERRRAEKELKDSYDLVSDLLRRIEHARDEEREKTVRDIHDDVGQLLTAISYDVAYLEKNLPEAMTDLRAVTKNSTSLVNNVVERIQRIAAGLHPPLLDTLDIVAAMEWRAIEFEKETGINCTVTSNPALIKLDKNLSHELFKVFTEALNNIARHSGATEATVRMTKENKRIALEINDNGRGFNMHAAPVKKVTGMAGMKARLRPWGGDLTIRSGEGEGTTVSASLLLGGGEMKAQRRTE